MEKQKLKSLDYLRVLAIAMIVYDHLGGMRNENWIIKRGIDKIIINPLYIIQQFGALGVSIFFLISGFLILYTNPKENYLFKKMGSKIAKIYISCLLAFAGFAGFEFCLNMFTKTYWKQFSVSDWFWSASLLGYFNGRNDVINGTTWFLIPLFAFYLISIIYIKTRNKSKIVGFVLVEATSFGGILFLFEIEKLSKFPIRAIGDLCFIFIPISGMLIYEMYKKEITYKNGIIAFIINYIVMLIALHCFNYGYYVQSPYMISYVYAILILLVFLIAEEEFKENKIINYLNKIGLPIYLTHMTWGSQFMSVMEHRIPVTLAFGITIMIVVIVASAHYAIFEKRFIRKIVR